MSIVTIYSIITSTEPTQHYAAYRGPSMKTLVPPKANGTYLNTYHMLMYFTVCKFCCTALHLCVVLLYCAPKTAFSDT